MQKRLFDVGWSTEKQMPTKRKDLKSTGCSQAPDPRGLHEVGTKSEDVEGGMEVAKRCCHATSK